MATFRASNDQFCADAGPAKSAHTSNDDTKHRITNHSSWQIKRLHTHYRTKILRGERAPHSRSLFKFGGDFVRRRAVASALRRGSARSMALGMEVERTQGLAVPRRVNTFCAC